MSELFDVSLISGSLRLVVAMRSFIFSNQMTSLYIRVYPVVIEIVSPAVPMQIPRSCIQNRGNNVFFMTLDANINISNCLSTANWKPLQIRCRQYKIALEVEYSSKWKSAPFVWNFHL